MAYQEVWKKEGDIFEPLGVAGDQCIAHHCPPQVRQNG
jgi:hypothetical protein